MPNKTLLSANHDQKNLTLYNENSDLIKTIDRIGNQDISPIGLAINYKNEIYISNYSHHSIDMIDLDFNKIRSFGTPGCSNDQLNYPIIHIILVVQKTNYSSVTIIISEY